MSNFVFQSVSVCCALLEKEVEVFTFESEVIKILWVNADSFVCVCGENRLEMYQIGKEQPVRTFLHEIDVLIFYKLIFPFDVTNFIPGYVAWIVLDGSSRFFVRGWLH